MAIDGKYGRVTIQHGEIGEDEPVFILRAKDKLALDLVSVYKELCAEAGSPQHHLDKLDQLMAKFREWGAANGTQVPTSAWHEGPAVWPEKTS